MSEPQSNPCGQASAEAERLRALLHAGRLPRERLVVASALGHVASRRALGRPDPELGAESQVDSELTGAGQATLEFWGRRLARFGPQVMLRTGAALARQLAVATEPPEEVAAALRLGVALCDRFLHPAQESPQRDELESSARAVARAALGLPADGGPRRACQALLPLQRALLDVLDGSGVDRVVLDGHYLRVLEQAQAAGVAFEVLQDAVRDELLLWALTPPGQPGP